MRKEDITQVTKIDREAFPSQWAPPNYYHEFQNQLAHYIVACEERETVETPEAKNYPEKSFSELASRLKQLLNHNCFFGNEVQREYMMGFGGIWVMAGEAHITTIAVREHYRRQGIGELLLISIIDLAIELNASLITLEVRISNTVAQKLYYKYGFTQVGLRHGYYTDNGEDAVLMSIGNITSAPLQTQLNRLKQAHSKKWGVPLYQITR